MKPLNVYVGWDAREQEVYDVCLESIRHNSHSDINIYPLEKKYLSEVGAYYREKHHNDVTSTDFAFTRFLAPHLNAYEGWCLFMDCDMIITRDLTEVMSFAKDKYALMCVNHSYKCKADTKMDGQVQQSFFRKNWSSFMLFNASHSKCKKLTPESVSTKSAAWLHQFRWCKNHEVGRLPREWNWLEGEYDKPKTLPANIHYTNGCPLFKGYEDVDYADEFNKYRKLLNDKC